MDRFTEEDPGFGDPEAIDELIWHLRRDQAGLEKAHRAVQKSVGTITEHWKGKAGDAAAAAHAAMLSSIEAKHAALDRAVSAYATYQMAHDDVKESAASWVTQLAEARKALGTASSTNAKPAGTLGMEDMIALTTRNKVAALEEEAEALSRLKTLHEARLEAQGRLRSAISEITSQEHSSGITARVADDPGVRAPSRQSQGPNSEDLKRIRELRRRANNAVWDMAGAWVTGNGPRQFDWNESDPFTQVFTRSASAKRAMADIQKDFLRDKPEFEGSYGARPEDLPRDLATILNGGGDGNLPEAFIGSFEYEYKVTKVNGDGTAVVTIHAWNHTTVESATRIPGTGDKPFGPYYLGPYASMKFIQDVLGGYQPIRQDITWTTTLRMP